MEILMLTSGGLLEAEAGRFAWTGGDARDGLLRLAIAVLLIASLVLTLEAGGLHWLWGALSGLHASALP